MQEDNSWMQTPDNLETHNEFWRQKGHLVVLSQESDDPLCLSDYKLLLLEDGVRQCK